MAHWRGKILSNGSYRLSLAADNRHEPRNGSYSIPSASATALGCGERRKPTAEWLMMRRIRLYKLSYAADDRREPRNGSYSIPSSGPTIAPPILAPASTSTPSSPSPPAPSLAPAAAAILAVI
jgi:hypothetical protein